MTDISEGYSGRKIPRKDALLNNSVQHTRNQLSALGPSHKRADTLMSMQTYESDMSGTKLGLFSRALKPSDQSHTQPKYIQIRNYRLVMSEAFPEEEELLR